LCVLAAALLSTPLLALTGREIVEKSEEAVRANSISGTYEITVKTRRWTRTMAMKYQEMRKARKSFAEITSPRKDAGNRFLMIENGMWHYVPKIQQTIKISPSMMLQSWMGSDFSNDDIVKESSILHDYTHKLLGNEKAEGHDTFKVELTPKKDAAVVWGKILYYARSSDFLPVKQEFFSEHGVLRKTLTCSDFRVMGGRMIPAVYTMRPAGKDRYTIMEIKSIAFNADIPARVFSLQNLTKR
jgi:outer membrane lipoprotein-sorting protein